MQLSKLVPIEKFKQKHSSKLEKAEILEVTVHYLTQQQMKKEEYELPTESSFTHDRSKRKYGSSSQLFFLCSLFHK